jgi:histidinol-phosphate aminotransferase
MFNLENILRSNIKSLKPYSCARDEYKGKEALDIFLRPVEEKMLPTGIRVVSTEKSGKIKIV